MSLTQGDFALGAIIGIAIGIAIGIEKICNTKMFDPDPDSDFDPEKKSEKILKM